MTLKEMIEQHPEWADLDVVLYTDSGDYEYVGASASVYAVKSSPNLPHPVLVFSAN